MPATNFRLIQHDVWLYVRFTLSYRDVEDLQAERRMIANNEFDPPVVIKFRSIIARNLRRLRPALGAYR